jgi:tripartite-type tricarboxylate transporter receptor subunit TctC
MTTITRRQVLGAAGALGAGMLGLRASAAEPRFEQARLVTGFAPGGTTDAIARRIAESIAGSYAKVVIVENKTGAATRIGIEYVKNSAPDGTTALVTPAGMMFMYPHIYDKLAYDPFKDFVAVSTIATTGFAFAVGPAVPASVTNLAQFVEWCRANPKQATYGSPASGSMPHLMIEAWRRRVDLDLVHTGYRGSAPAMLDLIGGQIPAATSGLGDFLPHLQSGKIRILATGGTRRTKYTPNVPTFIEQGVKDFVFQEDYAVFMPARTPAEHVNRMAADIKAALQKPAVQEMLDKFGLEPRATTPAELAQIVKTEYDRFGPIVKTIGFKAD